MVRSDVTVFHELDIQLEKPNTYSFYLLEGQNTLQHKSYLNLVREQLAKQNFIESPVEDSEYIVVLNYSIDSGREEVSSVPIYGQTGTSSSFTSGQIYNYGNTANFSGTTTYTPTYGVTGFAPISRTKYKRKVILAFVDAESLKKGQINPVYEATLDSKGKSAQLNKVMPSFIEAIFDQFPGISGKTRRVLKPTTRTGESTQKDFEDFRK